VIYDDRDSILRILAVGPLAYVSLVLLLRMSGKRTLSKMNAFDLVATIAIGSLLATVILNEDVALVDGIVAFVVVIGAQFVVTWSSVRSRTVERWVKAEPTLLYHGGRFLAEAMRRTRVTEQEIESAVRLAGAPSLDAVQAVILETDSSVSVLQAPPTRTGPAAEPDAGLWKD
jgi:uncharacterized membrane protein YcaP (DUF421 family)